MVISFGLIEVKTKSLRVPRGRKSLLCPEGQVALTFLKLHTCLPAPKPKPMKAPNGNVHYQFFCGIRSYPDNQLTNYKLIDSIIVRAVQEVETPGEAENTFRCMEVLHEELRYSLYRCKLL